MATAITVKNVPDKIYLDIKQLATLHHRSINSEIITIFERATKSHRIDHQKYLENARRLRELTRHHILTNDEINLAKNEGRL